jgi:hypothetical protein
MSAPYHVPIIFIIFNRPIVTARVFAEISKIQPKTLFVVADGPRLDHPDDEKLCKETRDIIDQQLDWECDVHKNYAETNMGCGLRVSSGIDWAFEQVEEAIILEDDCVPHPSFFRYCQETLDMYRDDERVMMISGYNYLSQWKARESSYLFSQFVAIWGWATWRRAWKRYDYHMESWNQAESKQRVRQFLSDDLFYEAMAKNYDRSVRGEIDTWDYQWGYACQVNSGLIVAPSVNLISNIGFGESAAHTKNSNHANANQSTFAMEFPLKRPNKVIVDTAYDLRRFIRSRAMAPRRAFIFRLKFWANRFLQLLRNS